MKLNSIALPETRKFPRSSKAGYSSVEEFIEHAVEKELAQHEESGQQGRRIAQAEGLGLSGVMTVDLGVRALWTLVPIGVASGVISVLVLHWTSDRAAVRRATNLILAHMLEFRLFLDEPILVLTAQRDLLKANLQLLRLLMLPCLILAVTVYTFWFEQLNATGMAALR